MQGGMGATTKKGEGGPTSNKGMRGVINQYINYFIYLFNMCYQLVYKLYYQFYYSILSYVDS